MNKFVATALIAAAALTPGLAAARTATASSFTRDGQTYVYTSSTHRTGQVIDGYSKTDGSRFHLVVRDGIVSGVSNGHPVTFRVSEAAASSLVETAAR